MTQEREYTGGQVLELALAVMGALLIKQTETFSSRLCLKPKLNSGLQKTGRRDYPIAETVAPCRVGFRTPPRAVDMETLKDRADHLWPKIPLHKRARHLKDHK